ncbi:ABC transporter substrate-binding protein [Cellulomonas sp. SG140]|uniref:ABC transporter substrate-binding protein n=1 Tax=Cellulomonas sp. SG140 TaxID=2976536 RepID=UPI0021E7E242|nr:extracellular solute-binding protein [Cellulomonas sp. SG140]
MKHHARTATAVVAGALLISLSACSSGNGSSAGSSTSAAKNVTLKLVQSGDANQGGAFQKLADEYKAETGTTVQIVEVPNDNLATQLRTSAQANDLPDLAAAPNVDPVWKDRILDLSDIAKAAKVKPTLLVQDPGDKKVKALPTTLTAVGMFINKTLWDKAGVTYPKDISGSWTWDDFQAKADQVRTATGAKYGAVMDASAHRMRAFLYQFGSEGVVESSPGNFTTNDKTAPALEYFKKMNDSGFMPKSVWTSGDDASAAFKSGQVTAYMSGVWQIADFQANITNFQWASVPMPQQPVRATNYGSASWMVAFKGTGHEQQTLDFIKWLYSPAHYTEYCNIQGCLPALDGITPTYKANADAFKLYNDEIAASPAVSANQTTDQLRNAYLGRALTSEPLKDETVKYLNGEQTLDQTIKAILDSTKKQLS